MTDGRETPAATDPATMPLSRLSENHGLAFPGENHSPVFEITARQARVWLAARNPSGRPNRDVLRPVVGAHDLMGAPQHRWTVDFPYYMDEREAALYARPFAWVRRRTGLTRRRPFRGRIGRAESEMRIAVVKLDRYVATPAVGRIRVFAWVPPEVIPERSLVVFARDDDWVFGVLHSRVHAVWVSQTGRPLRGGAIRYVPGPSGEAFPFPWPPGAPLSQFTRTQEERRSALTQAARMLERQRRSWLGDQSDPRRTLATLYATRPAWLQSLHAGLDEAVFAAYEWPAGLTDDDVHRRLLDLHRARTERGSHERRHPI